MDATYRSIAERTSRQLGLIARDQLREIGLTRSGLRHLVGQGMLEPVGAQVLRVAGVPDSFERDVLAACLDTGGVASHRTAVALHRLEGFGSPSGQVEVTVISRSSNRRSALARVHFSRWLPPDDLTTVGPIPATSVARTLFGLAGLVPNVPMSMVETAVDVAVRDRQASDRWLWWRLESLRRRRRNGVSVFEAVLVGRRAGAGVESWLERETLRILEEAGLPLPMCQQRIAPDGAFVARVDFLYPAHRLVLDVSGHLTHSTKAQRQADLHRDNELEIAGLHKLEFTYDDIVRRPGYVVATVGAALGIQGVAKAA